MSWNVHKETWLGWNGTLTVLISLSNLTLVKISMLASTSSAKPSLRFGLKVSSSLIWSRLQSWRSCAWSQSKLPTEWNKITVLIHSKKSTGMMTSAWALQFLHLSHFSPALVFWSSSTLTTSRLGIWTNSSTLKNSKGKSWTRVSCSFWSKKRWELITILWLLTKLSSTS